MDTVCVVVVTRNRVRLLRRCLAALEEQEYAPSSVIIIDNASTDETEEYLTKYVKVQKEYHYFRMKENLGGAGGFRRGMQEAVTSGCQWVLVMDDDAAPEPAYIAKLIVAANKNTDVRAWIGAEYVGYTDRIAYGSRRRLVCPNNMQEQKNEPEEYQQPLVDVDFFTFVGAMIQTELINQIGLPGESFFIYYDDSEYSLRIRKKSRICMIPDAKIVHREDFQQDVLEEGKKEWRQYYLYRNRLAIIKWYAPNKTRKYAEIWKQYLMQLRICAYMFLKEKNSKKKACRWGFVVTRATFDVLRNHLGKAEYIKYE